MATSGWPRCPRRRGARGQRWRRQCRGGSRYAPGGHHRSAQRRQVDPLQPVAGRGALHRPRHARDDARHHRHGGGHPGWADLLHRHRRACAARPRPIGAPSSTPRCGRCGRWSGPHIALLVIDATVGASHQDQRLAERIGVSGCPAIVVLNKWDQVPTDDRDDVMAGVGDRLAFLGSAPVLKVSALSGKGVHRILPALRDSEEAYHQRVPTGVLNRTVQELQARQAGTAGAHPLHRAGGDRPSDLHPLRQRPSAPDVPALHRARATGEVRHGCDADEAAGAHRGQVTCECADAVVRGVRHARRGRGPGRRG